MSDNNERDMAKQPDISVIYDSIHRLSQAVSADVREWELVKVYVETVNINVDLTNDDEPVTVEIIRPLGSDPTGHAAAWAEESRVFNHIQRLALKYSDAVRSVFGVERVVSRVCVVLKFGDDDEPMTVHIVGVLIGSEKDE